MNAKEVLQEFERIGAILRNRHVVYTSGRHGDTYVNKDAIYPHARLTSSLCYLLAKSFQDEPVEIVLGPALGGIILCQWVAFHLSEITKREILGIYAEKVEDGFILKRGYENLIHGKNVLLVEDVLTTGVSLQKVARVAEEHGGKVIGAAALFNRGGVKAKDIGIKKLIPLVEMEIPSWDAAHCPLCKEGVPVDKSHGKGAKK